MNTTMSFSGDCRADGVDHADTQGTSLQGVTQSHDGIRCLTALANEYANIVPEDGGFAIEEVTSKLNADGYFSQFFKDCAGSDA